MKYLMLILSLFLSGCVYTTGASYNRAERTYFIKIQDIKKIEINDNWSFEHGIGYNLYKTKENVLPGIDYTAQFNWKMLFVGAGIGYTHKGDKIDGLDTPYHDIFFTGVKFRKFMFGYYHESWLYQKGDGVNSLYGGFSFNF